MHSNRAFHSLNPADPRLCGRLGRGDDDQGNRYVLYRPNAVRAIGNHLRAGRPKFVLGRAWSVRYELIWNPTGARLSGSASIWNSRFRN